LKNPSLLFLGIRRNHHPKITKIKENNNVAKVTKIE